MTTWSEAAAYWVQSVETEKARRAALVAALPKEKRTREMKRWATMTGEFGEDNGRCWNVEPDGTIWSERFC